MTFDLVVTISMHFYERCQTKKMFEISDLRRREILHLRSVCVGSGYFLGFKILIFNIFGGFRKLNTFLGYEDFVDIFWGYHKIGLYLQVIYMHFRVFSEGPSTEWRIFWGLLKFQIFIWGA